MPYRFALAKWRDIISYFLVTINICIRALKSGTVYGLYKAMSIIHDALKKVQQTSSQAQDQVVQPVLASSPPTEMNRPIMAIRTTAISIAVVILMAILWGLARETTHPPSQAIIANFQPAAVNSVTSALAQPSAKQVAKSKLPSPKELGSTLVSSVPVKSVGN
jgi:hypothetical protein